jgi:cytochrome P450
MQVIPSYPADLFTDEALLDPHPHYRALRDLGPVVWLDAHQMYALPRFQEARAVLSDATSFCSGQGVGLNDVINELIAGRSTLMTDGEQHERQRYLLGQGLTPKALRRMQATVERLAVDRVSELVGRGSFDAVADLARALPLTVVPDLIGWPLGGREHLLEWASATFDLLGPLNARAQQARPNVQAMQAFTAQTAASGDLMPGSVGAAVIEASRRGELEPALLPALLVGFLVPSLDTTISAIGNAVWLLATHPDQWAILKADPSLIPKAFNEIVRLESPIRAFSRVATADTSIDDYEIPSGARLIVLYGSANRDERNFDRPDEFNIRRPNVAEQLGFGYGVHGCVGQGLARLEGHAVLRALIQQVETLEIGEPVRGLNNLISAWARLPTTVTPAFGSTPIQASATPVQGNQTSLIDGPTA